MDKRTINIHFPSDHFNNEKESKGKAFLDAITHLTTWNMTGYDVVEIHSYPDSVIVANYSHSTIDKPNYVICALWHEDDKRYSFHS